MLRLPCATDQSSRQFRKKGRLFDVAQLLAEQLNILKPLPTR